MTARSSLIVLRALGALLSYPRPELLAALPEIADVIRDSALLKPRERDGVLALIAELGSLDGLTAEERYVDLFDRGRATSLYLFEHLHGETRDRGQAMVELKRLYEQAGFDLATPELPDYLPMLLEYLSCRDLAETRDMLDDCAELLRGIGIALLRRNSRYAAIIQTLLALAHAKPLDMAEASQAEPEDEDLDKHWAEQPAFGTEPASSHRTARPHPGRP
jgi:nitrate reductase delta subunit